jgi:hypothetical protein
MSFVLVRLVELRFLAHGKPALGAAWPNAFQIGPASGPPRGESYSTVGYGLFEPFVLKRITSTTPSAGK